MPAEEKKSPAVPHFARNMIIGVITTVLVSAVVYFLGFSKKITGPTKLEREKATTEAWNTYVRVENTYAKALALLQRDATQYKSYKELFTQSKKESDKFLISLQGLIKDEIVDPDMITVLKRRTQNEKSSIPPVEKFYTELDEVIKTANTESWTLQRVQDTLRLRSTRFSEQVKGTFDRAITEIEDLSKTLSERYKQPFNIDDFFIIQVYKYKKDMLSLLDEEKKQVPVTKEYLIGKWDVSGATIVLYADANWTWTVPSTHSEASGTWELKNNQLVMNGKDSKTGKKAVFTFDLSDVEEKSFTMKFTAEPFTLYTLVRK